VEDPHPKLNRSTQALLTQRLSTPKRPQRREASTEAEQPSQISLVLSTEERLKRQSDQIASVIAQAIKGHRSLYGTMMRDAESAFKAIDKDGSGTVDYHEFSQAMKRLGLGLNDEQTIELAKAMDTDEDGEIDCSEFVAALKTAHNRVGPEDDEVQVRVAQSAPTAAMSVSAPGSDVPTLSPAPSELKTEQGWTHDEMPEQLFDDEVLRQRKWLREVPLFADVATDAFIAAVANTLEVRTVRRKTVLIEKGSPADEMYFILRGEAEVLTSLDGMAVSTLLPGSFFGETGVLEQAPRSAYVRAKTTMQVYALKKTSLDTLVSDFPDVKAILNRPAHERQKQKESDVDNSISNTAKRTSDDKPNTEEHLKRQSNQNTSEDEAVHEEKSAPVVQRNQDSDMGAPDSGTSLNEGAQDASHDESSAPAEAANPFAELESMLNSDADPKPSLPLPLDSADARTTDATYYEHEVAAVSTEDCEEHEEIDTDETKQQADTDGRGQPKAALSLKPPRLHTTVVATRRVLLRLAPEKDSRSIEVLQENEAIVVLETRLSDAGQLRLRCNRGWVSFVTEDGTVPLFREPNESDAAAVAATAELKSPRHLAATNATVKERLADGHATTAVDYSANEDVAASKPEREEMQQHETAATEVLRDEHVAEPKQEELVGQRLRTADESELTSISVWLQSHGVADFEPALRRAMVETVNDLHFLASSKADLAVIDLSSTQVDQLWGLMSDSNPESAALLGDQEISDGLEARQNLDTERTVEMDAAAPQVLEEQEVKNPVISVTNIANARYCKKCKAVFEAIEATTKCPGSHANFMYTKRIPEGIEVVVDGAEEGVPPESESAPMIGTTKSGPEQLDLAEQPPTTVEDDSTKVEPQSVDQEPPSSTAGAMVTPLTSKTATKGLSVFVTAETSMRGVILRKAGKNAQVDFSGSGGDAAKWIGWNELSTMVALEEPEPEQEQEPEQEPEPELEPDLEGLPGDTPSANSAQELKLGVPAQDEAVGTAEGEPGSGDELLDAELAGLLESSDEAELEPAPELEAEPDAEPQAEPEEELEAEPEPEEGRASPALSDDPFAELELFSSSMGGPDAGDADDDDDDGDGDGDGDDDADADADPFAMLESMLDG
jgi:CRP-like cAMP-binding protein